MSDDILFGGMRYISASEAAVAADLTRDYIARLCRDEKVKGRRIGKNWYVEPNSLFKFLGHKEVQKTVRNENLSKERLREYHKSEAPIVTEARPKEVAEVVKEKTLDVGLRIPGRTTSQISPIQKPQLDTPRHVPIRELDDKRTVPKIHTMEHAKRRAAYLQALHTHNNFKHKLV